MLRNFVRCNGIEFPCVASIGIEAKEVNAGGLVHVPGLPDGAHILFASSSSMEIMPLVDRRTVQIPSTFGGNTGVMALVSKVLAIRATRFY